ncbi:MAG TPA: transporter substrate-binding domain-containing protein [Planctomycetota bacterium]|nr:transporter substrate-binding domain-containing protein [Planctomycetota bacterium]
MKKISLLCIAFFTAIVGFVFVGCGDSGGAKPGEDTLAKIKREGVLKWGADYSGGAPFVFKDPKDNKTVIGFEMDIMEKFAKHMGVKAVQTQAEWDSLIEDMVSRHSTDMVMNGIEINEEREKAVGLSEPYYIYEQQITIRAEDKDKYKSLDDLKGKKIATLTGAEANNVLLKAGFDKSLLVPFKDSSQPYEELENKRAEAVLQESIIAAYYAGPNSKLYNIPKTFSEGKYAVAVRKEDKTLLAEVNRILKLMKENGELAEIYKDKKWNIWNEKQKEIGVQEKK